MNGVRTILLILVWLASQQVAAVTMLPTLSSNNNSATHGAFQASCHEAPSSSLASQPEIDVSQVKKSELSATGGCCEMICLCAIGGHQAVSISGLGLVSYARQLNINVTYLRHFPQPPSSSLFRPPISG